VLNGDKHTNHLNGHFQGKPDYRYSVQND